MFTLNKTTTTSPALDTMPATPLRNKPPLHPPHPQPSPATAVSPSLETSPFFSFLAWSVGWLVLSITTYILHHTTPSHTKRHSFPSRLWLKPGTISPPFVHSGAPHFFSLSVLFSLCVELYYLFSCIYTVARGRSHKPFPLLFPFSVILVVVGTTFLVLFFVVCVGPAVPGWWSPHGAVLCGPPSSPSPGW